MGHFLRTHWLRLLLISTVVLIPCFWHSHIEAGDLGSHVYNAWLAQGIEHGQAPGLMIVRQWSNILFDEMLSAMGAVFGLSTAQKIAVSLAVLLFFWGGFALVCTVTKSTPWFLLPLLAALAYGWTFNMGFFNFYLSLGFAFVILALWWGGGSRGRWIALLLLPLAFMAHYFGVALLAALILYRTIAERLPRKLQVLLLVAAILAIVLMRIYVTHHYPVVWPKLPFYLRTGADQFILFGNRYRILAVVLQLLLLAALAVEAYRRRDDSVFWEQIGLPLQLYALVESMVFLLPQEAMMPPYGRPSGDLSRLTVLSAVLLCCMLGAAIPRVWHRTGIATFVTIFFAFLWTDTGRISRLESQVAQLVRTIPAGNRITVTYWLLPNSRIMLQHIVDRACVGHCYVYDNFEPSSRQFRIRAMRSNPIVQADPILTGLMESGRYVVQPQDTPLYQVYLCGWDPLQACLRELPAGVVTRY